MQINFKIQMPNQVQSSKLKVQMSYPVSRIAYPVLRIAYEIASSSFDKLRTPRNNKEESITITRYQI